MPAQEFIGAATFREQTSARFKGELRAVARRLEREMNAYVTRYTLANGRFVGSAKNLARLANSRNEIDRLLVKAGYTDVATRYVRDAFPGLSSRVTRAWNALDIPASLSTTSEQALRTVAGIQLDQFANIGARGSDRLRAGLMEAVTGGQDFATWSSKFRETLYGQQHLVDRRGVGMFAHAGTLATTAIDQVNRLTARLLGQDAGIEFYEYFGGVIETTRPFCEAIDGEIFHIEEITSMDNGQTADVFITGGGYNCRHEWLPVLLEDVPAEVLQRVLDKGIVLSEEPNTDETTAPPEPAQDVEAESVRVVRSVARAAQSSMNEANEQVRTALRGLPPGRGGTLREQADDLQTLVDAANRTAERLARAGR